MLSYEARAPLVVPVADATDASYVVGPGTGLDGVGLIDIAGSTGTGALLATGRHVLTAAHLWDGGNQGIAPSEITVAFTLPDVTMDVASFTLHPQYDENDADTDFDIAVIELAATAPDSVDRYAIYRASDEVGQVGIKAGYGLRGTGTTGQDADDATTVLRAGQNVYDVVGTDANTALGTSIDGPQLLFDFDNGNAANDVFGVLDIRGDLGRGEREVNTASGDSGGPMFLNGQIAGVTAYGFSPETTSTDIDGTTNSTFGEVSADTRVSGLADWIDATVPDLPSAEATLDPPSGDALVPGEPDDGSGDTPQEPPTSRVVIDADGTATASGGETMFGRPGGAERVVLDSGATGVRTNAEVDGIDLPFALSTLSFQVGAEGLEISANDTVLITLPSLNDAADLRFSDGNAALRQTGAESFTLTGPGGQAQIGTTPSTPDVGLGGAVAVGPSDDGRTFDASSGDTTFDFAADSYDVTIENLGEGDVLDLFDGASLFVLSDADQTDGEQPIQLAGDSNIVTITLTGLSEAQDSGVFNQSSFQNVFGASSLVA